MKIEQMCFVVALMLVFAACSIAGGMRNITGILLESPGDTGPLKVAVGNKQTVLTPAKDMGITRGQLGKDARTVGMRELAAGDDVVATVNASGQTVGIKAFFGVIKGEFARFEKEKLVLKDGRSVSLSPHVQMVLSNGKPAGVGDITPGTYVICRVNPTTNKGWTILVAQPEKTNVNSKPAPVAKSKEKPAPAKPKIASITYSAPAELKAGDLITVDLAGMQGGEAGFAVKGLIPFTPMKELKPGSYRAVAKAPEGKQVRNAPLVGYLSVGGVRAAPVQANRLVTTVFPATPGKQEPSAAADKLPVTTQPPKQELQVVAVKTTPENVAPAVQPQVVVPIKDVNKKPEPPTAGGRIVITNPSDGAKIRHSILVKGLADANSKVTVEITYSNGRTGFMKLAGQVALHTIAVAPNGEFRVGPIALEGPLATRGLEFTIKAYYAGRTEHATASVKVIGDRR